MLVPDGNKIILHRDESGEAELSVLFSDSDVWVTQAQMAELYGTSLQNVCMHITNIFDEGELDRNPTIKDFLIVRQEGIPAEIEARNKQYEFYRDELLSFKEADAS